MKWTKLTRMNLTKLTRKPLPTRQLLYRICRATALVRHSFESGVRFRDQVLESTVSNIPAANRLQRVL